MSGLRPGEADVFARARAVVARACAEERAACIEAIRGLMHPNPDCPAQWEGNAAFATAISALECMGDPETRARLLDGERDVAGFRLAQRIDMLNDENDGRAPDDAAWADLVERAAAVGESPGVRPSDTSADDDGGTCPECRRIDGIHALGCRLASGVGETLESRVMRCAAAVIVAYDTQREDSDHGARLRSAVNALRDAWNGVSAPNPQPTPPPVPPPPCSQCEEGIPHRHETRWEKLRPLEACADLADHILTALDTHDTHRMKHIRQYAERIKRLASE